MAEIRLLDTDDLDWVHRLNEVHAIELSSMAKAEFATLVSRARFALAADPEAAFLLAFDQQPTSVSPNFDWLQARYEDILYIDRVAVAATAQRRGLASAIYRELFERAAAAGFARIGCEVNSDPPNPASDAFHVRHGFVEAGVARLADRGKTVRYFVKEL
jgi:predicted GNAT superfamily acetyltransferase